MLGEPCALAADCHPEVDAVYAVCVDGACRVFDQASGYGSAKVNLSFRSDMYKAASGYVHFLLARTPEGQSLTCEQVESGEVNLRSETINRLTIQPKYLVFHWNGTFFPDNLIQFIRPGDEVLAVAEGYAQFEGQGPLTAIGCEPDVTIETDQMADFTIALIAP